MPTSGSAPSFCPAFRWQLPHDSFARAYFPASPGVSWNSAYPRRTSSEAPGSVCGSFTRARASPIEADCGTSSPDKSSSGSITPPSGS